MSRFALSRKEEELIIKDCKAGALKACEYQVASQSPPLSPSSSSLDLLLLTPLLVRRRVLVVCGGTDSERNMELPQAVQGDAGVHEASVRPPFPSLLSIGRSADLS